MKNIKSFEMFFEAKKAVKDAETPKPKVTRGKKKEEIDPVLIKEIEKFLKKSPSVEKDGDTLKSIDLYPNEKGIYQASSILQNIKDGYTRQQVLDALASKEGCWDHIVVTNPRTRSNKGNSDKYKMYYCSEKYSREQVLKMKADYEKAVKRNLKTK